MRYAEVGCGLPHLMSTEVEVGEVEWRVKGFEVGRVVSVYVRVRCLGREVILDTRDGLKVKVNKIGYRFVFGVRSL